MQTQMFRLKNSLTRHLGNSTFPELMAFYWKLEMYGLVSLYDSSQWEWLLHVLLTVNVNCYVLLLHSLSLTVVTVLVLSYLFVG